MVEPLGFGSQRFIFQLGGRMSQDKENVLEKTIDRLSKLIGTLPSEEEGKEVPPDSLMLQGVIYGSQNLAIERIRRVITNVPGRIYELDSLLKRIGPKDSQRVLTLYNAIMGEVAQLGEDFQEAREAILEQGKSVKTLRRYERATRDTLKQLLDFLKLQMVTKEGQIPVDIIGNLEWRLNKGDNLVLGPGAVYSHDEGVYRGNLWTDLHMLNKDITKGQKAKEVLLTAFRRLLTGESIIQDRYTAERDGAKLYISSDEIGGNIVLVDLTKDTETKEIITRKCVYFGSEEGIILRVYSPPGAGRKIYGPGLILQKFSVAPGYKEKTALFLQIDGEVKLKQLKEGETISMDPRNSYAWESSIKFDLSEFGSVGGRLMRGDVPYWIEFKGPGKIWYSNSSFQKGYVGFWFTPTNYVHFAWEFLTSFPSRLLGLGKQ